MRTFNNCTSLEYLSITKLSTSSIYNFNNLFKNCQSLKSLPLPSFNSNVSYNSLDWNLSKFFSKHYVRFWQVNELDCKVIFL